MTAYITATSIQSVLDSNWDTGVIAKPSFDDWNVRENLNHSTVYIGTSPSKAKAATTGTNSKDRILTTMYIRCVAESKANVDKYLDEIRRIINTYTGVNGHWHIDSWELHQPNEAKFFYDAQGTEILYDW